MSRILGCLVSFLLLATVAYGAVAVNENGTYQGEATTLDFPSTWISAFDGSTATVNPEKQIRFYPEDFGAMVLGGTVIYVIDPGAEPGLEINNGSYSLNWGDADTSYATVTFRVPADYASGGGFRVLADQDGSAATESHCEIEFQMRVTGTSNDSWNDLDTPVDHVGSRAALAGVASGSPEAVTLTPTATFAAGDMVTLQIWRSNHSLSTTGSNSNATADLEVYYVEFYYSTN